jgi:hypothetical protein
VQRRRVGEHVALGTVQLPGRRGGEKTRILWIASLVTAGHRPFLVAKWVSCSRRTEDVRMAPVGEEDHRTVGLRHASPTRAGPALGGGARWVRELACATGSIWSIEPTRRASRRRSTDGSSVDANRRVVVSVNDSTTGRLRWRRAGRRRRISRCPRPRTNLERAFEICADKCRNRSRVHPELALRPGCSARARMPPTARACATRREAGATGFDCGAGAVLLRASPRRPGGRVPI